MSMVLRNPNGTFAKGHGSTRYFVDISCQLRECSVCRNIKAFSEFHSKKNKLGINSKCKVCVSEYNSRRDYKSYYHANSNNMKSAKRKHLYGLSEQEYQNMLLAQDNKCAACHDATKLVVDHCHTTGKIRGLLCRKCNTALGQLDDSKDKVVSLLEYISNV